MKFRDWKKTTTALLSVSIIAIGAIAVSYSAGASVTDVTYDFETGTTPSWSCFYSNVSKIIETEENGNKYLKLSYNGNAGRDRTYFDVKVEDIEEDKKGILHAEYDVMYSEIESEKNGEIQFKKRTGPGSSETTMVARVAKNLGYFRTQNASGSLFDIKGLDNQSLPIEVGHWYTVKLIVDLDNGKQTTYIFDRDTQNLLSYSEPTDTIGNNTAMNMITFSSSTDMCIDNLRIYYPHLAYVQIYGSPHVSAATKNKYYVLGKDDGDNITAVPTGTNITWSLESERNGVSIDADTARIIVGSNPEPGPVLIKATVDSFNYTEAFMVNVSK